MPFSLRAPRSPRATSRVFFAVLFCVACATAATSFAQTAQEHQDEMTALQVKPIYVTARVFQLKAKRGAYGEVNSQVFKMKTEKLTNYEQWMTALKKTYPEFEAALLRTEAKRVFRTAKPSVISLGKQPDGRDIEIMMYGAQSVGDGTTPGTSLIPEISLHFGNDMIVKPVTYVIQQLEVETGGTYFFAASNMKMSSSDYVKFVRPNAPAAQFDGSEIFLVFAFSVDLEKPAQAPRAYDERQSVELQNGAAKKVNPEAPSALREAGFGGVVRVNVEISPAGKVTTANVQTSTFPEMNGEAITAARQWEFPASLFTENKNPINGYLTFSFPGAPAAPKAPAQSSAKQ
jgi:TonB family protein